MINDIKKQIDFLLIITDLENALDENNLEEIKNKINILNENSDILDKDNINSLKEVFFSDYKNNFDSYNYAIEHLNFLFEEKEKQILLFNIELQRIDTESPENLLQWISNNYLNLFDYYFSESNFFFSTIRILISICKRIKAFDIIKNIRLKLKEL